MTKIVAEDLVTSEKTPFPIRRHLEKPQIRRNYIEAQFDRPLKTRIKRILVTVDKSAVRHGLPRSIDRRGNNPANYIIPRGNQEMDRRKFLQTAGREIHHECDRAGSGRLPLFLGNPGGYAVPEKPPVPCAQAGREDGRFRRHRIPACSQCRRDSCLHAAGKRRRGSP